ncbi:hypothetical protein D3C78_1603710 [compost metagenome]
MPRYDASAWGGSRPSRGDSASQGTDSAPGAMTPAVPSWAAKCSRIGMPPAISAGCWVAHNVALVFKLAT